MFSLYNFNLVFDWNISIYPKKKDMNTHQELNTLKSPNSNSEESTKNEAKHLHIQWLEF